jgi:hypothetical protein
MDIKINIETDNLKLDPIKFQKMLLLFNTIEDGWTIKKKNNTYIFTKNHENKKEILDDSYLLQFMNTNLNLNKIIS